MLNALPRLVHAPEHAWLEIREKTDRHPWGFLPLLFGLALLPAVCTYIGAVLVGWSFFGEDDVRYLDPRSGFNLALMCYLAFPAGVLVMAVLTRWVLFRKPQRPTLPESLTFNTVVAIPLMLGGLSALHPERWLLLIVAVLTSGAASVLLFIGVPVFMRMTRRAALFPTACILGFGFLALLTTGFIFLEFWLETFMASEYLTEPASGFDDFPTQENAP
ncbi:MAG TPA: Yip1 family protein [Pseudomonas sp.]|nr:Yip1 family protein [Pseudomonas sp.]